MAFGWWCLACFVMFYFLTYLGMFGWLINILQRGWNDQRAITSNRLWIPSLHDDSHSCDDVLPCVFLEIVTVNGEILNEPTSANLFWGQWFFSGWFTGIYRRPYSKNLIDACSPFFLGIRARVLDWVRFTCTGDKLLNILAGWVKGGTLRNLYDSLYRWLFRKHAGWKNMQQPRTLQV